jgi:phytoene dehydrogenase-like protein
MPSQDESVEDYFVSFSHPDDELRAPKGWQTVTISIHTTWSEWAQESSEKKAMLLEKLWGHFQKTFPDLLEVKFLTAGTPKTFERYTLRPEGRVGGLPHRWSYPLWRWPGVKRAVGLYQVGDTVFPGQGIVACVTGAMEWYSAFEADLKRRG